MYRPTVLDVRDIMRIIAGKKDIVETVTSDKRPWL